jgi:hypothetical protein
MSRKGCQQKANRAPSKSFFPFVPAEHDLLASCMSPHLACAFCRGPEDYDNLHACKSRYRKAFHRSTFTKILCIRKNTVAQQSSSVSGGLEAEEGVLLVHLLSSFGQSEPASSICKTRAGLHLPHEHMILLWYSSSKANSEEMDHNASL